MSLPDGSRRGRWSRLWLLPAPLLLALLGGFAYFAGLSRAQPELPLRPTDGVAVLTGGPQRVEAGMRLLAEGEAQWLIVSGVSPVAGLDDLARNAGFPAGALEARTTLGHVATSTRGNGREIAAWAESRGIRSLRVVTAAFHMPRALLELRRNLPGVTIIPHPVQTEGPRLSLLVREYLKLIGAMMGLSAITPEKLRS